MTHDFATTVAAVAPVIWLVGTVEYLQAARQYMEAEREETARMEEQLAALEAGDAAALAMSIPSRKAFMRLLLVGVWCLVSGSLATDIVMSLGWLANPGDGPRPAFAAFCYWSIGVGVFVVSFLAVTLVMGPAIAAALRPNPLHRRIEELKEQIRDRQQAATPDDGSDVRSGSPPASL